MWKTKQYRNFIAYAIIGISGIFTEILLISISVFTMFIYYIWKIIDKILRWYDKYENLWFSRKRGSILKRILTLSRKSPTSIPQRHKWWVETCVAIADRWLWASSVADCEYLLWLISKNTVNNPFIELIIYMIKLLDMEDLWKR